MNNIAGTAFCVRMLETKYFGATESMSVCLVKVQR